MSRKRLLLGLGTAALAAAGFFGYRALGDWLTKQMTGKIKPPESATTTAAAPPAALEDGVPAKRPEAASGLDLILKSAASAPPAGVQMSRQQLETVRQAGLGLVDSLKPLLKDPALTSRLSPAQAQQYAQLMSLLDRAEKAAKSNGPIDMRRMAADVQKAQQISLSLMSQLPQTVQPARETPRK